jgi:protein MpaA
MKWLFLFLFSVSALAQDKTLKEYCIEDLKKFPGAVNEKVLTSACSQVEVFDECKSVKGHPIYHFNKKGEHKAQQKILVFSLIHGDEAPAGTAVRLWLERLEEIVPRNNWRVIPMLNPDGVDLKTRTNANKIDINRNFPTKDWDDIAIKSWKKDTKSNPRRFPGDKSASEPETKCAMKHIEEFKPDFIVSIHTPLKVLDFDGPKIKPPKYDYLPWKTLGHFPGSLGRYMWFERKTPVLTMELKEDLPQTMQPLLQLQDIIGYLVSLEPGKTKPAAKSVNSPATTHKR